MRPAGGAGLNRGVGIRPPLMRSSGAVANRREGDQQAENVCRLPARIGMLPGPGSILRPPQVVPKRTADEGGIGRVEPPLMRSQRGLRKRRPGPS